MDSGAESHGELDASRLAAASAGAFVLLVGTLVLVGWALDVEVLKTALPGLVSMKPNAALALCALGLSLLLVALPEVSGRAGFALVRVLSALAGLLGAATLLSYFGDWGVPIDQLLFVSEGARDRVGTAAPGRMAPDAALALLLGAASIGLWTSARRSLRATAVALGLLVLLHALWWLARYALGSWSAGVPIFTAMALHTAVALAALGFGAIALGVPSLFGAAIGRRGRATQSLPWVLLVFAGFAGQLLWWTSVERSANDAQAAFEQRADEIRVRLADGMRRYELLLRTAAAAVQTWPRVDRRAWQAFVGDLALEQRYPGLQGLGYVQMLDRRDIAGFERARRAEGLRDYRVWPHPGRAETSAITYLEPLDARNRRALGFDMLSEEVRAEAMRRARDSGQPALSGRVRLVQEGDAPGQAGFLLYMPVYAAEGGALDVAARRASLSGYVYSPFRAGDLMQAILPYSAGVATEVYDGTVDGERTLLARSAGRPAWPLLMRDDVLEVSGRKWTLRTLSEPALELSVDRRLPVAVLIAGSIAALLGFGVAWMLAEQRAQAERTARESTSALLETEASFRAMVDAVHDYGIFRLDPDGRIVTWNRGAERIKGYSAQEALGRHFSMFYSRDEIERGQPAALLAKARQGSASEEGWHVRKDGSCFWASTITSPLRSAAGELTGFVRISRDNTALMEAEQTLRNANVALDLRVRERTQDLAIANERFELAVRGSSDGLWDWDIRTNAVYHSPRFQELLGFVPGEAPMEQSFAAFESRLHPEDRERVARAVDAHLRNREPYDIEYRLRTESGEYRWFRARGEAVRDDAGMPLRMAGSITDVTARRQTEDSLRESEERLRLTLDNALDAFIAIDEEGHVVEWNRQASATFGWSRDEALGGTLSDMIIPPEMRERHESGMEHARATGEAPLLGRRLEFPAIDRDGRRFPVELSIVGVSVGGRRIYSASLRDISERRQAEEALRKSEAQLQAIIDNSPAVIYVKDLDGRYLLINRQFETLFHVRREEVRGKTDHDYFPAEMADAFRQNDRDVLERNGVIEAEESAPVDGVLRTYLSAKFPLADSNGRVYATCGISTDITERKGAEERLAAFAARLEASNRELEEFARVASHDLQEPLRKVASFAERLQGKYAQSLDEQGLDYIARMTDATRRMGRLIGDLLNYSRVTTRAQPFQRIDLNAVVAEVVSDLEVRIEESGARVEIGDLPAVDGDRVQMQQLLQNLIGNALKFLKPDGEPRVRIEGRIERVEGREYCVLTVADNGIGFAPQHAERIFGVFQRLHGRGEYEGSGVGLAICRKIVARHGGTITAHGVPGEGATFTLRLPVYGEGGSEK
jgi:PAS domain S-box-containing protein